jgi:putative hydrolase of the HAD superfamily
MRNHGVDPGPYLDEVHDIDFSGLTADPTLANRIDALPGRKIVFTNGCEHKARQVIDARGLSGLFDAVYGVEHAGFHPKPDPAAFDTVFALDRLDPAKAAMFEDDPRNLTVPHAKGMKTVHVADAQVEADHIHFHTVDLSEFLGRLV